MKNLTPKELKNLAKEKWLEEWKDYQKNYSKNQMIELLKDEWEIEEIEELKDEWEKKYKVISNLKRNWKLYKKWDKIDFFEWIEKLVKDEVIETL